LTRLNKKLKHSKEDYSVCHKNIAQNYILGGEVAQSTPKLHNLNFILSSISTNFAIIKYNIVMTG